METTATNIGHVNRLGSILKAAREEKHLSPETAARHLNIRLEYLQAIEENRFDRLPSGLYAKNYIKKYAIFVGIPRTKIDSWLQENLEPAGGSKNPFSKKIVRRQEFIVFPQLLRNLILLLVFLTCLSYLAFYLKKVLASPELIIYQPSRDLKTTENRIEIKGETEPEAELDINGETILNTDHGKFSTIINLKKGINDITVTAKKKYGGESSVLRQILVE